MKISKKKLRRIIREEINEGIFSRLSRSVGSVFQDDLKSTISSKANQIEIELEQASDQARGRAARIATKMMSRKRGGVTQTSKSMIQDMLTPFSVTILGSNTLSVRVGNKSGKRADLIPLYFELSTEIYQPVEGKDIEVMLPWGGENVSSYSGMSRLFDVSFAPEFAALLRDAAIGNIQRNIPGAQVNDLGNIWIPARSQKDPSTDKDIFRKILDSAYEPVIAIASDFFYHLMIAQLEGKLSIRPATEWESPDVFEAQVGKLIDEAQAFFDGRILPKLQSYIN